MGDEIPREWLVERLTSEEAERRSPSCIDDRVASDPELGKSFGGPDQSWEELKALTQPGDELWTFMSPPESWDHLAGRAGLALLRENLVVASLVTLMN